MIRYEKIRNKYIVHMKGSHTDSTYTNGLCI